MWKWTNPKDIQLLILDGDSLEEDYLTYSYTINDKKIKTIIVTKKSKALVYENFKKYYDTYNLIHEIIIKENCESYSIVSISRDILFLKSMMEYHIGTILVGSLKYDFLKNIPDYDVFNVEDIVQVLNYKRTGYGAEIFATYNDKNPDKNQKMSLLYCSESITLSDGREQNVDLYFGGRYYANKHMYILNDPLSYVVKKFKSRYVKAVDLFFDSACIHIARKEKIDYLTYIPLKPKDIEENKFDRFKSLKLPKLKKGNIRLDNLLKCTKDFSQKGNDLYVRREVVKGTFQIIANVDIENKTIVIVDDVFSTGSTIFEATKTLYEAGAKKVIAIILSVNQLTESSIEYKNLKCKVCGSNMKIRMKNNTGELFFGCENYMEHKDEKNTAKLVLGMDALKKKNKFEIFEIIDLLDEF
ncbi:phosphoribosyltransferase family protein [uncultured Catenibacterium sp.]|uniref:ComF family protein n=1 Tax=uncultured Catenibacterium sp. TaxID=286142 RepID=UPI0025F4E479|nr:phosphoribosyltransferase family protein [uncultured Catenibacterium sp.]